MTRIEVVYTGALGTQATHAPSGRSLETEAPPDNRGRGGSFSPTDLIAAAFGSCMLTLIGIAAEDAGLDVAGATASVDKVMAEDPRRIARLVATVRVPGRLDGAGRSLLEGAARGCPVCRSVAPGVETEVSFDWGSPQ